MEKLPVSAMAENLIGSEIIKLAGEVKSLIASGKQVHNFTIGDFDPNIYPIPSKLQSEIVSAYDNKHSNYPPANGVLPLRKAVSAYIKNRLDLNYTEDEVLVAGGSRPLIFAFYSAVCDPSDKVLFPVPSWNNNHYTHLHSGSKIELETTVDNFFMPTAAEIEPHLKNISILALCSPQNPTGTVFTKEELQKISALVVAENKERLAAGRKPIYVLYDHIYWTLTYGDIKHYTPEELEPEMRNYTVYIDGISKGFAATGVRVGFAYGAPHVIAKMKSILGHVGAWAPKAEQIATAEFLNDTAAVDTYLEDFKANLFEGLNGFYRGIQNLKAKGYAVDAIKPQAAIYLTVQFNLVGKTTTDGKKLENTNDVTSYLLNDANLALVPFKAFGTSEDSTWYRLSVGTAKPSAIADCFTALEKALEKLV